MGGQPQQQQQQRLRIFDHAMRKACWEKADVAPGRHPERWRLDAAGNVVCHKFHTCMGCLCYEYDHIIPFSRGGETSVANCQILQTRVNRMKGDKDNEGERQAQSSCDLKFSQRDLDVVEMAVYGDVIRPGLQCRVRTVAEAAGLVPAARPPSSYDAARKQFHSSMTVCSLPSSPEQEGK